VTTGGLSVERLTMAGLVVIHCSPVTGLPLRSVTVPVRICPTNKLRPSEFTYGYDKVIVNVGPVVASDPRCTVTFPGVVPVATAAEI
jgi:hypothetical protein